jgi:hypothetical protein
MTKRTKLKSVPVESTDETKKKATTHELARAIFKLRLNLNALAAVIADDGILARPSSRPIHLTAFHEDVLAKVREAARSALSTSLSQILECFHTVYTLHTTDGPTTSVLRAIRAQLEIAAQHLNSGPFTNDRRMMASQICDEACDLCGLAIRHILRAA